jgi:hypothetical protein
MIWLGFYSVSKLQFLENIYKGLVNIYEGL